MPGWQVGIDIGGTFTDVVAIDGVSGKIASAKVRTFRNDPIKSLLGGLEAVGLRWDEVDDLVHGTTAVTNAIVEGRTAKVALVTTEGFADVLAIGRQNRRDLYRLDVPPKIEPQVPSELCFEVEERTDYKGNVVSPLNHSSVERLAGALAQAGVDSIAISLLHSYANPVHERELFERLKKVVPHVALSHRVNPEVREFERASTTVLSASVMPLVSGYIDRLEASKPPASRLHFFHSASGLCAPVVLRELPLALALSGPAAGVAAASRIARELGLSRALTFDMGGTTTDVCLIVDGEAEISADRSLAGRPLRAPAVAVEAVGAGGGSVVRYDGRVIRVGPDSAGADPGPACYGLGGVEPTLSDADILLGYLQDGATFGGNIVLSRNLAEKAIAPLAGQLALSPQETAQGIVKVANNAMSNALRRVTVERGIDARSCALIAFGGAGPMHAVEVARLLGIRKVIVPGHSSALSALGCVSSDISYTLHRSIYLSSVNWDKANLDRTRADIIAEISRLLGSIDKTPEFRWIAAVRYAGQSYAVELPQPDLDSPSDLGDRFRERHSQLYGFATDEPWEVVALRLTATVPRRIPRGGEPGAVVTAGDTGKRPQGMRQCYFAGSAPADTPEYERTRLAQGRTITGPAIISDSMSTLVLPPHSHATVLGSGHLDVDTGLGS